MGMKALIALIVSVLLLIIPVYVIQVAGKLILFVFAISWLYSLLMRRFLHLRPEQAIVRGFLYERNLVQVFITNNSLLPISMLAIRDDIAGLNVEGANFGVFNIPARSQINFTYKIWSSNRGMFQLGPMHIAGSDPMGLFPWTLEVTLERLVFIYPHMALIHFQAHHGLVGGPVKSFHPMFLDSTQLRSIRPYNNGDDTRYIHWKASARTGSLQITEFTRSLTIPFYIILNLNPEDFSNKRKSYHLERIVEAASAFMDEAGNRQFSVGLLTNGTIPTEARFHLFGNSEELPFVHVPISPALQAASQILSLFSVIGFGSRSIISTMEALQLHLTPRCIVITPPLEQAEYAAICTGIPRSCHLDFWFLDEHINRPDRVDHRSPPPLYGIKIHKLPEYGEELLNQEPIHG